MTISTIQKKIFFRQKEKTLLVKLPKKKATGGNAVVDRMYGGDKQFGSGKREKDAFKPPKLVSSIYGDMSHTSSKAISYKI